MRVTFQGERGAFSEEAARKLLGRSVQLVPSATFEEAFQRLKRGEVQAGLLPIENTLAGSVHENYDLLLRYRFPIVAETRARIVHNLIAPPGLPLKQVRQVLSHPVALGQCRSFFRRNRQLEAVPFYDTAGSVKMIMEQRPPGAAAIASAAAASIYGARILRRGLEDDKENYTRFFLLVPGRVATRGAPAARLERLGKPDKTSIVFAMANVPGSLFKCLAVFALRDINLTKIESRPLRGRPWEYFFYLDFLGTPAEPHCRNALRHLGELTEFLHVLGSYPRAE
jgi:prephenate dehydratase